MLEIIAGNANIIMYKKKPTGSVRPIGFIAGGNLMQDGLHGIVLELR